MKSAIYKYNLEIGRSNIIKLPLLTQVLSVETQKDNIVLYGLVNVEEKETALYDIKIYGTGYIIDIDLTSYTFLGTVKTYDDRFIWHVFYKQL
jgi:hypothetical protein